MMVTLIIMWMGPAKMELSVEAVVLAAVYRNVHVVYNSISVNKNR